MTIDQEILNLFCDEALDLLERWERLCLDLVRGDPSAQLGDLFRIAHNLKGGSRAVGLMDFGNFIHKVEDGIVRLRDERLIITEDIQVSLLKSQEHLTYWCQRLKMGSMEVLDYNDILNLLDGSLNQTNVRSETESKKSSENSEVVELGKTSKTGLETIRVSALKLDEILQTIGELSIQQNILFHNRSRSLDTSDFTYKSIQLSQKLIRDLYERAMNLRMQPLESLFQRLERNTKDLSKALNKRVTFISRGSDVEVDKSIIEKIIDPLTHIMRNAIDHGIESTTDRQKSGKKETGIIEIEAKQDTFGVLITITDDGKGLDSVRIRQKALERGLVTDQQVLSPKEVFSLIFLPGFSTAEKVTEISGRGVGMDVVRRSLTEINGRIEIDSEKNKGTRFSIILPTSVNIIEGLLVRIYEQVFVIPIHTITEVVDVSGDLEKITHQSEVLPLIDFRSILKMNSIKANNQKPGLRSAIICNHRGKHLGFVVEKVLGQQQVVVRPLNENIAGGRGILGGTVLGTGDPGLILDLPKIADFYLDSINFKEAN